MKSKSSSKSPQTPAGRPEKRGRATRESGPEVRQVEVGEDRDGQRVDNFLASHLKGVPRSAIYRLIRTGQVRVNGGRCKPDRRLSAGDSVRIPPARTSAAGNQPVRVSDDVVAQLRAAILYESPDFLVVDKPSGMAVHAGSGLPWGLIDAVRQDRPGRFVELAHRIDRETSGCLVLALNGQALRHLSQAFRDGAVTKRYLCLLTGRLPEAVVTVDRPIGRSEDAPSHAMEVDPSGKPAVTVFRVLERFADCTYAEAELHTGRTHQIRVHAAHLGMPLAGDARYGDVPVNRRYAAFGLKRLFLHAHRLQFNAMDGTELTVSAPLPPPLRDVLTRLAG